MKMLLNNKGQESDFSSLLNQALVRFHKTVVSKKDFTLETNYINYILGIAHFVWIKELKVKGKHATEQIDAAYDLSEEIVEIEFLEKERRHVLKEILGELGLNCREVLMFWSSGYSMVEIAEKLGYKSPGMAKKKKHVCMKALYAHLESNPDLIEELK